MEKDKKGGKDLKNREWKIMGKVSKIWEKLEKYGKSQENMGKVRKI